METLVALLNRERLLAELVVFKLVELRQLLLAGEARFLPWASEEVERATTSLHKAELERAVLVAGLADERGVEPAEGEVTLQELLDGAPEPWRTVLVEQADQLRVLCREAADLLDTVRRLADTGLRGVTELLGRTSEPPPTDGLVLYGRTGRREAGAPVPRVAQRL